MQDTVDKINNPENLPAVQQPAAANVPMINGKLQPNDLEGLWRLACILADSGIVPKDCTGKPGDVFGKLALGMEVGLSMTQSLTNVAVINGKPSLYGDAGLSLIHASGKLESIKETFEGEFGHKDYKAVCSMKRKDGDMFTNEFSVEDAITIGKWGKDIWAKYPKRMLKWRARWQSMRDGFADVLNGMGIYEEIKDSVDLEETSPSTWEKKPTDDSRELDPAGSPSPEEEPKKMDPFENPSNTTVEQEDTKEPIPEADEMTMSFMEHIPAGKEAAMGDFVAKAAEMNGCPVKEVYSDAMKDINIFVSVFERWYSKQPQYASVPETKTEAPPEAGPSTEDVVEDPKPKVSAMTDQESMASMVAMLYAEYGQKTSAEPLFCRYVDTIVSGSGMSRPQVYAQLLADKDLFFGNFESWQLTVEDNPGPAVDPGPEETTEAPASEDTGIQAPGLENTDNEDPAAIPENFYRKWFSMKPSDFDAYVWANVKIFELAKTEKPDLYLKAKGKWNRFYSGQTFPPETDASKPEGEPNTDTENPDLKKSVEDLWTEFPDLAQRAMDKLKTVKIPPSDEGKQAFLETARQLYRGEIK